MYKGAIKKYKGFKFAFIGHSQSGVIVNNLCSDKIYNCISINPALKTQLQEITNIWYEVQAM